MTQKDTSTQQNSTMTSQAKRPNETGIISVEGFVKIYDPKSQEIFVEKRA
jgi:hypothetical protein